MVGAVGYSPYIDPAMPLADGWANGPAAAVAAADDAFRSMTVGITDACDA